MNNNAQRAKQLLSMYNNVVPKVEKSEGNDLEKGGKRAVIGETRIWNNQPWVKHQDGWVNVSKKGKATIEKQGNKRFPAEPHHIEHFNHHMENDTPVEKTDEKVSKEKVDFSKLPFNEENAPDIIEDTITKMKLGDYTLDGFHSQYLLHFKEYPHFHINIDFKDSRDETGEFESVSINSDFPEGVETYNYDKEDGFFIGEYKSLKEAFNSLKKIDVNTFYNKWERKAKKKYEEQYKRDFADFKRNR